MQHRALLDVVAQVRSEPERKSDTKSITLIIPVRLSERRLYDETERLARIAAAVPSDLFDILIVDFGSSAERARELRAIDSDHVQVVRIEAPGPFSAGLARDHGALHARTPVILFHDLDLIASSSMYRRIAEECQIRNLATQGYDFFCVPAVYLSNFGTQEYIREFEIGPTDHADRRAIDEAQQGRVGYSTTFALATSTVAVNRYYYLTIGGHDPSFAGHGAEDYELLHRMAAMSPRAPRPPRYYENLNGKGHGYNGFRAYFATLGIEMWMRGIALLHLEHPRREQFDEAYRKSQSNFAMLPGRMEEFDKGHFTPRPLADPHAGEKTLVLAGEGSLPAKSLRMALPALGQYECLPESVFQDSSHLMSFVIDRGITQVLFLTPYGNQFRLSLWRDLKAAGIRTITYDRGALPDSWFFDRDGFLADGDGYARYRWDRPLSAERRQQALDYIQDYVSNGATLESNGERRGGNYWRTAMNLGNRKVILVPFQRPADVATKWFGGAVGSAETFAEWIEFLHSRLDKTSYVIVAKKHPLESDRIPIKGVTYARDYANINDLIELADKVITINSGTGLLAMLHGKASIVCGRAFYQHEGLAHQAISAVDLVKLAHAATPPNEETLLRFVSYLTRDFYSFGAAEYRDDKSPDGSSRRSVFKIKFRQIVNLTPSPILLGEAKPTLPVDCFLLSALGAQKQPASQAVARPTPARASPAKPNWGPVRRTIAFSGRLALRPFLSAEDLSRMRNNPIDFFKKAKWPPNRFFGRLLLDKSQRPY